MLKEAAIKLGLEHTATSGKKTLLSSLIAQLFPYAKRWWTEDLTQVRRVRRSKGIHSVASIIIREIVDVTANVFNHLRHLYRDDNRYGEIWRIHTASFFDRS